MKNKSLVYECSGKYVYNDDFKNIKIIDFESEAKHGYCDVLITFELASNLKLKACEILEFIQNILNSNAHANTVAFSDIANLLKEPFFCELVSIEDFDYKPCSKLIANISDSLDLAQFFIFVANSQIPQALVYSDEKSKSLIFKSLE